MEDLRDKRNRRKVGSVLSGERGLSTLGRPWRGHRDYIYIHKMLHAPSLTIQTVQICKLFLSFSFVCVCLHACFVMVAKFNALLMCV